MEKTRPYGKAPAVPADRGSRRALEPIDRIMEVLFGLIMVLTFTGSLSAAGSGRAEIREMLIGALGCNLAWGLIDAIMYLMTCMVERGQQLRTVLAVRTAATAEAGWRLISDAVPPLVAAALSPKELENVRLHVSRLPEPPARPRLSAEDWRGAAAVFLLVFLSTLPVVVPFLFVRDAMIALRISNAVAVSLMFLTGYGLGRLTGFRPWLSGVAMVLLGAALVGITIALGG
jgi:hypothetical protein